MKDALLEKALKAKGIFFGEYHTPEERTRIEEQIKRIHQVKPFDFILSEEVGGGVYLRKQDIQKAIAEKMWSISDRTYQLCLQLNLPAIGIDVWDKSIHVRDKYNSEGEYTDARYSFAIREARMVSVISTYLEKGRIAVIVGDTHLRKSRTKELGNPSPLYSQWYANKSVCIIRSPVGEIA